ncbi:hypothetical protein B0T26DRAFT_239702 [Lasiosphaeria miniovina]|uniref:RRM domain-containing protein n=1 Tax=Lasiosphaeria miniovina TaxID=1954250 RepID=A0AA40E3P1_9PEZI|nr:uncharacterized protein B0T26DRAFT_239702 [Lasiosphaeria miniovina]KAK0722901.1 hypothetical protein B0T26DRAFT_239702 [Lasiosphaeria miniovina]
MSGSHRNSQKLNFVSVLVEPGRETGIFYIPVANLARGTTWRELRAFVEKGAQCVVDRVEVYPPDSGYVRVADEASFDRVFYFLNGGVLKERGLIAFDGNRTEKVAVKVQEDDPQFASIVSSPKSPSAMGTPIQGGLPLVSYPEPFPGSPQAGVSYPGVAAGSNPGLQYTTTSSYQGYGTGSPLQYHTSPQLASPGLPSLGVSSPASYQYTYSPTEQYSQVYPMYTGVAGTAVAQCPGAEFGYGLYDSYSQQAQPWPGQVTAVEAAGYGNTALGGGQFGDPDKRAIMIKNMSFDGLNDAKIRGYIYNHVSQDAGNKVQSVEIPAQRSAVATTAAAIILVICIRY